MCLFPPEEISLMNIEFILVKSFGSHKMEDGSKKKFAFEKNFFIVHNFFTQYN